MQGVTAFRGKTQSPIFSLYHMALGKMSVIDFSTFCDLMYAQLSLTLYNFFVLYILCFSRYFFNFCS
jgi:hypothetical protein